MNKVKYTFSDLSNKINRNTRVGNPVKIENNTYAEKCNESVFVVLHGSVIADLGINRIILYSNGWRTQTTKDRINKVLGDNETGFQVFQENNVWYLTEIFNFGKPKKYRFNEGITVNKVVAYNGVNSENILTVSWNPSNFAVADDSQKIDTLKRQIRGYVKRYLDQLNQSKIVYPNIKCWGCEIKTPEKTHLRKHIKENQFPFNLLINAVEKYPISILAKTELSAIYFQELDDLINRKTLNQITINQLTSSLSRYLINELITNS